MIKALLKQLIGIEAETATAPARHSQDCDLFALSEQMIPLPGLYGISGGFIDPYWWYDEQA